MSYLQRICFVLLTLAVASSCQEKTKTDQFLRSVFNDCKRITDAPNQKIDAYCHCVADKVVATHTVEELKALGNNPTDLVQKEKPREAVLSCLENSPHTSKSSSHAQSNPDKPWRLVRSIGRDHFVYMPISHWNDKSQYATALTDLCDPKDLCTLSFWADEAMIPTKFPLTREQAVASIPIIATYGKDGAVRVIWGCELDKPSDDCPPKR